MKLLGSALERVALVFFLRKTVKPRFFCRLVTVSRSVGDFIQHHIPLEHICGDIRDPSHGPMRCAPEQDRRELS